MRKLSRRRTTAFVAAFAISVLALTQVLVVATPVPAMAAQPKWASGLGPTTQFSYISNFSEGLAIIYKSGKYGYIDETGSVVITPQFYKARPFSDGLAAVQDKSGKWGFIDKTGKYVIAPKFDGEPTEGFSEGYAVAYDNASGNYRLFDKTGAFVFSSTNNVLGGFHEGLAAVDNGDYRTGFIDTSGAFVIPPTFDSIGRGGFAEGLAPVKATISMFGNMFGYCDKTGALVIPSKFALAYSFSDGRAKVLDNLIGGHWGYTDKTGEWVIPAQFEDCSSFTEGLAPAKLPDGRWGYIDKAGKWVIAPQFEDATCFSDGLALVWTADEGGFIANPLTAPKEQPDSWAKPEVDAAIAAGLVPQDLQNGFKDNITREDFCRLAVNLIEVHTGRAIDAVLAEKSLTINATAFTDTQNQMVLAANALGIVGGKGNGIFDPSGSITRQEAAAMLMRTAKVLGYTPAGQAVTFTDTAGLQVWAKDGIGFISRAMDTKNNRAVMGGTGNGTFSPAGPYTRQQAYMTIVRLYNAGAQ